MTSPKLTNTAAIQALNNSALSRRSALQIELAVALLHFTDEGDTTSQAKANLKSLYHASGYQCEAKADRDYKTVNRRLNAGAKLFEKLGSSLVNSWTEKVFDMDALQSIVDNLQPYALETMDDVLEFVGANSNKSRAPRQPIGKVTTSAPVAEAEESEAAEPEVVALTVEAYTASVKAELLQQLTPEEIRAFCAELLVAVAEVEQALPMLKAA